MVDKPQDPDGKTPPTQGQSRIDRVINNLADRSTGLPQDGGKTDPDQARETSHLTRLAGLGLQFAATVAIFAYVGRRIDVHYGWSMAATLTLSAVAIVGNFYLIIKEVLRMNAP